MSCYFNVPMQKWHVRIYRDNNSYHIGYFKDEFVARKTEREYTVETTESIIALLAAANPSKFSNRKPVVHEVIHDLEWFQAESKRQLKHFAVAYK